MAPTGEARRAAAIANIRALTARIKQQDRTPNTWISDFMKNSLRAGDGFYDSAAITSSPSRENGEESLFVNDNDDSDGDNSDADYNDEHGLPEDDDDVVMEDAPGYSEDMDDETVKWLNGLAQHVKNLRKKPEPGNPTPCPGLAREPMDHQYSALATIEHHRDSDLKGILIGDLLALARYSQQYWLW